ncbi:sulfatase-like hydrolase/transferase [Auraticoccus sp. F435]|uniref:Sulfatase-like hydrolase/transferase n=2 Tax=Auraticoccus cholistanensis TaxID=2656650 RepID=A0A6A9UX94_9ACTN|nr:arylsulfatase [Auraticoccus cholistanensis]MVA75867.1 sulfatase-like hydrolase/transferase [Auraticoccus cholistanensis]
MSQSRPWWPEEVRAPAGAPNVVVVLVDDLGYADTAPYGGEIETPHLAQLAAEGVQLTGYHTLPLCSPARASLLTGVNAHRAGFAYPANSDPGHPAFDFRLPDDAPTLAESFRASGYATFAVGKWHLAGDRLLHDAADKSSWPLQRGFDRYFGSLEGFTSLHAPHRLVWDNSPYEVDSYPDGYYLTDELTDRAVGMIRALRSSDARKPFFLWFAHHAVHGPIQARDGDVDRYAGVYDSGWDHVRSERFRRQVERGLFPEGTRLPDAPEPGVDVPAWDSLSPDQRRLFARYMEVYAAAVTAVDDSVGRLRATLAEHGDLENTIIVFASDNGGTAEGGVNGTRSYFSQFVHLAGLDERWERDVERDLDLAGGPQTAVHYPRGWGRASNTPFRLYKGHTHAGGVRAPLLVSWPAGLPERGLRHQYVHATDLAPTLLELARVPRLAARHGIPATPPDGVSAVPVLRSADALATHTEQYAESGGHRSYTAGRWKIVTRHLPGTDFDDREWALHDLAEDPTETRDLAARRPELVADLARRWEEAAWANRVFPLDDHGPASALRRPADDHLDDPVRLLPGTPTLERVRSARLLQHRHLDVTVELALRPGDRGVLVAHGDQGGGYLLAVDPLPDGRPAAVLVLNAYGRVHRTGPLALQLGPQRLLLRFEPLPGFRWRLRLAAGGAEAELGDVPQLLGMAPFTGISVGADRGGPVEWERHLSRRHDPFTGVLHAVTYTPGRPSPEDPRELARLWLEGARIHD